MSLEQIASEAHRELSPKVQAFLNSLTQFQSLAASAHYKIRTHNESSLNTFVGLPEAIQENVIHGFQSYLDFLTRYQFDGLDLRDDKLLLRSFLKKMGFIYDDGLLDEVTIGDVVEVYTMDQIQIFRNLAFMDLCNYTLLDLLAHDPFTLYERSEKIKAHINDGISALFNRPYNLAPYSMGHVPQHVLREKFSEQKLSSLAEFKSLYPLYTWPPKDMVGLVAIQTGRNIHSQPTPELSFL